MRSSFSDIHNRWNRFRVWAGPDNCHRSGHRFVPRNWSIAGIGDFDRDGYSDILWRDHLGNVRIWLLGTTPNSLNIRSSADLGNVPLNWSIVQTGEYNGDGFSDILWQDDIGNLKAWFMQGTIVAKTQILGKIGPKWTVQSLNDQ